MTDLQATSPPARPVPARGTGSATSVKLAGFSPLTALLIFRLKGPTATVHIYSNVHRHGHYRQKRSHVQSNLGLAGCSLVLVATEHPGQARLTTLPKKGISRPGFEGTCIQLVTCALQHSEVKQNSKQIAFAFANGTASRPNAQCSFMPIKPKAACLESVSIPPVQSNWPSSPGWQR